MTNSPIEDLPEQFPADYDVPYQQLGGRKPQLSSDGAAALVNGGLADPKAPDVAGPYARHQAQEATPASPARMARDGVPSEAWEAMLALREGMRAQRRDRNSRDHRVA